MSYYISSSPQHCLIDFSNLVLKAHNTKKDGEHLYVRSFSQTLFKLGRKTEKVYEPFEPYYSTKCAYKLPEMLDLFVTYAKAASATNSKPAKALKLIKDRTKTKYYSGVWGNIKQILNRLFGWFKFEKTPIGKKIEQISTLILTLPQKIPPGVLKKIKASIKTEHYVSARKVFTDNLKDQKAIGALSNYCYKPYRVIWMSPRNYLNIVDVHFKRHNDEDSLPWIYNEMAALIKDEKNIKFAPLMLGSKERRSHICEKYYIRGHEGRHRALAAEKLGLAQVPVAVAC